MSDNLSKLAFLLGSWAQMLPPGARAALYKSLKVLAALGTVALLVLPSVTAWLPNEAYYAAIITAALAFVSHVAGSNLSPDPTLPDVSPAPEGGNPEPLPGTAAPSDPAKAVPGK